MTNNISCIISYDNDTQFYNNCNTLLTGTPRIKMLIFVPGKFLTATSVP